MKKRQYKEIELPTQNVNDKVDDEEYDDDVSYHGKTILAYNGKYILKVFSY